jgi:hypothetical protein
MQDQAGRMGHVVTTGTEHDFDRRRMTEKGNQAGRQTVRTDVWNGDHIAGVQLRHAYSAR